MINHTEYGFSSKDLCIRPRDGPCTRTGTPLNGLPRGQKPNSDILLDLEAINERKEVDRLEQQVRDALFARTTAHMGEQRILKNAFSKFDKDASGNVDLTEFALALEHLGLHTEEKGLPGQGGLPMSTVKALFRRYDKDDSGSVDYEEFAVQLLQDGKMHKML